MGSKSSGRPPHKPTEKERAQVKMLVAMGIPDYDVAKVIGISEPTMRKYYSSELQVGHVEANAKVAQSLFKQATDKYKPNAVAAMFWLKCRAGWNDRPTEKGKKEIKAENASSAVSKFVKIPPPIKAVK